MADYVTLYNKIFGTREARIREELPSFVNPNDIIWNAGDQYRIGDPIMMALAYPILKKEHPRGHMYNHEDLSNNAGLSIARQLMEEEPRPYVLLHHPRFRQTFQGSDLIQPEVIARGKTKKSFDRTVSSVRREDYRIWNLFVLLQIPDAMMAAKHEEIRGALEQLLEAKHALSGRR